MKVFRDINKIKIEESTSVALGNFDGVHLGHQAIIRKTVANAKQYGYKSVLFTFTNHPRNFIHQNNHVKNIISWEDKIEILETLGLDYLVALPFDKFFNHMKPEVFVKDILVDRLHMKEAHCGFHYRFGHKSKGSTELLIKMGMAYNFAIHILEAFKINEELVSSTKIRNLISEGDLEKLPEYLGKYYTVKGIVVHGNKIGKHINFPTCNTEIDPTMIIPPDGIYVTKTTCNGVTYKSVTNIGKKPTIGSFKRNIETYILDFNQDIYGQEVLVQFLKKIRDELKFHSLEALSAQIALDVAYAKEYHEKFNGKK